MEIENLIIDVTDIAHKTGIFQREQRQKFDRKMVETKGAHDYVSYVDKESEKMIVEGLRRVLPEAEFITEEKTTQQTSQKARYVWIVDPLDGTTNYIHDLGPWCVCIALKVDDEIVLGVVYEVVRDELYYAIKGHGAWMMDASGVLHSLNVSAVDDVDQSLVMVGYPYNAEGYKRFCLDMTERLYGNCISIRSMGSAEAELCYVAAGRIDVYFESYLQPWDVSAGAIIVREAGGKVSDYKGTDALWPSGRQMLATNGILHASVLKIMQSALQTNA